MTFIKRKNCSSKRRNSYFLRTLMKAGLPLMESLLTPLAKIALIPLGLSAGMSAADAVIERKFMDQVVLQT